MINRDDVTRSIAHLRAGTRDAASVRMFHTRCFPAAAIVATIVCACATGNQPAENDAGVPTPSTDGGSTQPTATQVRGVVRDAWQSEAQWTRFFAISANAHDNGQSIAFAQLSASEDAIAATIGPYAGQRNQDQLAALLKQRAQLFAYLATPSATPTMNVPDALASNATQIAQFFGGLGSAFDVAALQRELSGQLNATIDGINQHAQGQTDQAAASFDASDQHTLNVADLVTAGLVQQYSDNIGPPTTTANEDNFRLTMRSALNGHAFWIRLFVIDRLGQVNAQPDIDRASEADVSFGGIFRRVLGDEVGYQAQTNLHLDTTDATSVVLAIEGGNQAVLDAMNTKWNADADQFAQFMTTTTPNLSLADMQTILRANVDNERAQINARFANQFDVDAASYDLIVANWNTFAEVSTPAIFTTTVTPK